MMQRNLYDAMPYAYMTFGALTTALLDSPLKYMPAILFFSAGTLIFTWRHMGALKRRQMAAARTHQHSAENWRKG